MSFLDLISVSPIRSANSVKKTFKNLVGEKLVRPRKATPDLAYKKLLRMLLFYLIKIDCACHASVAAYVLFESECQILLSECQINTTSVDCQILCHSEKVQKIPN